MLKEKKTRIFFFAKCKNVQKQSFFLKLEKAKNTGILFLENV